MKKFVLLLIIVGIITVTYACPSLAVDNTACYAVYTKYNGDTWLYKDVYMTECDQNTAKNYRNLPNAVGYSKRFKGDYDDLLNEARKHNARIIASEEIGGAFIYYGISDSLGKTVNVDGKIVNIQLAIRGSVITVGTPLIMGSY